ncbi:Rv3235 family protein [Pedococcus sp.]|uniref:Rv3235 family protein n=1 Tax=Pedococcus sp. TaxID=2860345 RepID=UPI002E0E4863|nr:Rv3235 family protein [Pedococcus sp.]
MSAAAGDATPSRTALVPLHVLPAPRHRPPVLPEPEPLPWEPGAPRSSPFIQDALAVDFSLMSDEQLFGAQPTRRSELPDPQVWAGHVAQGLVEVMAGARPAPQLLRWTTPEVYAVVARRASVSTRRGVPASRRGPAANRRATVRSVRVCEPADGVAEVCAVVVDGPRVRALAMRLVGLDGRWRVEALQVG